MKHFLVLIGCMAGGFLFAFLPACARQDTADVEVTVETNSLPYGVSSVTLSDGTRCVVYRDSQKGGIDCDYTYTKKPNTQVE